MVEPPSGDDIRARLALLGKRVDRMAVDPQNVTAPWTTRLARPFYRLLGWQPELSVAHTTALLSELRRVQQGELAECSDELERALEELADNVQIAERACVVNGRLPLSQLAWLTRLTRVLGQAAHALRDTGEAQTALVAAAFDAVLVAPPLTVAREPASDAGPVEPVEARQTRLVELQLAAIDHIIEAARSEQSFLDRRRSLLEAARRLLLDADAAMLLDGDGVRIRKRYLTEQIVFADRLQATGLSPHVSLLHQARAAVSRGQRHRLHAALAAMEGYASAAGDQRGAVLAQRALDRITSRQISQSEHARRASFTQSVADMMGADVVSEVHAAYAEARGAVQGEADQQTHDLALEYLAPGAEDATLSLLLNVDGCFDVGAPLSPVRIRDRRVVARVVDHPTQEMLLTRAQGPQDLPAAIIEDPRSVLLDLAAGRLFARKFVRYEEQSTERIEMMGEVRVYLLDGSTSMMETPARARMRDAILTAELATLLARFKTPDRFTRVLMFYRYFTKRIWPLQRVATAPEALAAIGDVLSQQRDGGTNIELALTTCFDMIREARATDSDLARGQVVLITDGEATVREAVVRAARERVGEIPIAVSVIALGQENEALRRLVAGQRARGERAFYHHIDDQTLSDLTQASAQTSRTLHLPADDEAPLSREALEDAVGGLLDEAAELERGRHHLLLHGEATDLAEAFEELGLDPSLMSEGQRALREASASDRRSLEARYRRWFPTALGSASQTSNDEHEDAMVVLLTTVAEVVGELDGDTLSRRADAIDVLDRLLPDARLSPAHYDALLRAPTPAIRAALDAVHAATDAKHAGHKPLSHNVAR